MPFVHLQVQSAYSLLSSSVKIEKLVEQAKHQKFRALAITDVHVMYGAIAFYKLCEKHGVKPIIGLTASVLVEENQELSYPLVLLAENNAGYRNLLKISSALQTKSKAGMKESWLKSYREGVIAVSPGHDGVIEQLLLSGLYEEAEAMLSRFVSIYGKNSFYLSIQKVHKGIEEQNLNRAILELSEKTGVKAVATNNVHFLQKEDAFAHKCLLAVKEGKKLSEMIEEKSLFTEELYLKSAEEMAELFADNPEVLENSLHIAQRCHVKLELGITQLPTYPAPQGESADEYLERICLKGLKERFPQPDDSYYKRLTYELDIIKKMQFSDYFLIVWDFMKHAHEQGILTGPGRGSAAGSLVAYALKITNVDPIEHRLLFERFLNPERVTMPDIDIDFPDNRRDEMITYVTKKYGAMHVAQIITFGTLAARAALRDVGRVMGISAKEADRLTKMIPSRVGITLQEALNESPKLKEYIAKSELANKIFETALKLEGLPRHTSTHAAGVVFSEQPLTDVIPIQEGHEDVYLTQYSMDYLEDLGLLKMDFLGLRNLTLIQTIIQMIEKEEGKRISFAEISYRDKQTFNLLSRGDTTGVFQLESDGMRSVLKRLKPTTLEDIVAVNALYRPGPMENIPHFIKRKHKQETVRYLHPDLEPILRNTYGVIVYQEQIMEIASKMAGFTLGEADLLRRAVGKKIKELLDKERDRFVTGCLKKGYKENTAHKLYDLIVKFANYGFNRSHSVAYSMIGFQLAYLKTHFPLYFTAALLTSVIGNDSKIAHYLREAKQQNIEILPPSINKSSYPFIPEKKGIRFSLAVIKSVGVSAVKEIFHVRKQRPFQDFFDFCVRVSHKAINRKTIEALIMSGAMDEFNKDRAVLLASVDVALEHSELFKTEDDQLDFMFEEEVNIKPKYIEVEPLDIIQKLDYEKEVLGFYFSAHPISAYSRTFQKLKTVKLADAYGYLHLKVKIGAIISKVRTIRTKAGAVMAFLTISDETSELEAVAFPDTFSKLSDRLYEGAIFCLEGKVENRNNQLQFIIQDGKIIDELEPETTNSLFLKIEPFAEEEGNLKTVKEIIQLYKGQSPVYLYYVSQKKTIQLPEEYSVNPTDECISLLRKTLGEQNVVCKS
ncbi:DNA polymerase III subunit alpha [Metabacillus arenae]|uniref:DNA polymerase III subunit alpha n=1 Tax=Metabacillus arenae TaxID=2771434 RepID=A0A926RXG4_9BACI|nr:DNA polymerase III subunit alpha [Metabacillus arenae]MBD1380102.1 DNA polymerase III subunit alpha [Metabacillus arenae]